MNAIVLTYDRNAVAARHMIVRYEKLWPDHPFVFRLPFQDRAAWPAAARCEFVPAPPGIPETVRALLADLPDEEWVYWCIDDKYPVRLILARIAPIVEAVRRGEAGALSGILFCRTRRLLDPAFLTGKRALLGDEVLLERKAYHQIWIHQLLRVKVLRALFDGLPSVIGRAGEMDALKDRLVKPADHGLFVTETNLAVFGESLVGGVLTANALAGLTEVGLPVPAWQPAVPAGPSFMGRIDPEIEG